MTIENLDQSKRDALESGTATPYVQDEALRIIDQLTAALEAAERKAEGVADSYAAALRRANERAEALQERVAELETAEKRLKLRTSELLKATGAEVLAESRTAALQKRVAELEADRVTELDVRVRFTERAETAESELEALQARVDIDASTIAQLTTRAQAAESELEALRGRVALALASRSTPTMWRSLITSSKKQ